MPQPLYVAFIWHMHQPYYRDLATGACSMPWVRLHATKDYLDMLTRLEAYPAIRQTFNMVPSLLDQLEDYLPPKNKTDHFYELSQKPAAALTGAEQRFALQWFFLANPERMIRPYPRYHDLLAKRGQHVAEDDWAFILKRYKTQDYLDLQVWFNLTWIDPWLRDQDPRLAALVKQGSQFTEADKAYVLAQHLAILGKVVPAYQAAAARGQVELTTTPYYHPILPLLCDLRAARVALPDLPLPEASFRHAEDADWHLREALARHEQAFGRRAQGVWPSEGSVSEAVVDLAIRQGVRWFATDEEVLWRTLKTGRTASSLYRPHRVQRAAGATSMVFRDRELSDLVGFVYSRWEPRAAVEDFLERLARIQVLLAGEEAPGLVSIILDGENAWEYYERDGHDFLSLLYQALSGDARFQCVTVSEYLDRHPRPEAESLPELHSGSWIDANFATWIGHPEKNAAWELLASAREAFEPLSRDLPQVREAWRSLGAAEGSDWMWWFGDTHFSAQADEFDQLFRTHLTNAYRTAGLPVPPELSRPIRRRTALPIFLPTGLIQPVIDGRDTSYYEWLYAGRIDLRQQYAAIHRGDQCLRSLAYGFSHTHHYFRIDVEGAALRAHADWLIELGFAHEVRLAIRGSQVGLEGRLLSPEPAAVPCAMDQTIELAIPIHLLRLEPGERLHMSIALLEQGDTRERYPAQGTFELIAHPAELDLHSWPL